MAEKPKKKLPDGTLVDVDILAAEATKAEKDVNGVPLVNRVGEIYTHPEKQNTIVVVYSNGIKQEYIVNNVSEANHASTADKAKQDINGVPLTGRVTSITKSQDNSNIVLTVAYEDGHRVDYVINLGEYLPLIGGVITGDLKVNGESTINQLDVTMLLLNALSIEVTDNGVGYAITFPKKDCTLATDDDIRSIHETYLPKSGGAISGELVVENLKTNTGEIINGDNTIILPYKPGTLALLEDIPNSETLPNTNETVLFEGNTLLTNDFNVVNKNQITSITLSDYVIEGDIIKVYITGNDTYPYIKGGIIEFEISKYTRDDGSGDFYFGSGLYMADYEQDQTTVVSASVRERYTAKRLNINIRNLEEYDFQAGGVPTDASELYVKKIVRIRHLKGE